MTHDASSARRDASPDAKADMAKPAIQCGISTCDPAKQYCRIRRTGSGLPGANVSSSNHDCPAIPMQCGANPTCECIAKADGCTCGGSDGGISTECVYPSQK